MHTKQKIDLAIQITPAPHLKLLGHLRIFILLISSDKHEFRTVLANLPHVQPFILLHTSDQSIFRETLRQHTFSDGPHRDLPASSGGCTDDSVNLGRGRHIRSSVGVRVVQGSLRHLDKPERLVDVFHDDAIGKTKPCKGLSKTQDPEECTRGRVSELPSITELVIIDGRLLPIYLLFASLFPLTNLP